MPAPPTALHSPAAPARPALGTSLQTRVLLWTAIALPAVAQVLIVARQRFLFPYQDDYAAILGFALQYRQRSSVTGRLLYIAAAQHNEYKLMFEHGLVALQLMAVHHLLFGVLTAAGNACVLLVGCVLWAMVRRSESLTAALWRFAPLSLIFFATTYWETLDWAMAGLQNLPVIVWALLSLHLLFGPGAAERPRLHFVGGCLAGVLAASSSANGFMLVPVGLLGLLPVRAYRRAALWCCVFLLPLAAYLYHYTPVHREAGHLAMVKRPLFFVSFFGAVAPSRVLALLVGAAVLGTCAYAARAGAIRRFPAVSLSAVWIMLTGLLTAWVRGTDTIDIASRYRLYSALMLVFCLAFLMRNWTFEPGRIMQNRLYVGAVALCLILCVGADTLADRRLSGRRHMVQQGMALYEANPAVNSPMIDPNVDRVVPAERRAEQEVLTRAIQNGIYAPPAISLAAAAR